MEGVCHRCAGLPAGFVITTDTGGDAGTGQAATGGRGRNRAIPIDLIEVHQPICSRSPCLRNHIATCPLRHPASQ